MVCFQKMVPTYQPNPFYHSAISQSHRETGVANLEAIFKKGKKTDPSNYNQSHYFYQYERSLKG